MNEISADAGLVGTKLSFSHDYESTADMSAITIVA